MNEVPKPAVEAVPVVLRLVRSLVAAARAWSLYPADHPAVDSAFGRLQGALAEALHGRPLAIGVTPTRLLIEGLEPERTDRALTEAAALLHDRDILQITFAAEVPIGAIRALLNLLKLDLDSIRTRGGPSAIWAEYGHKAIAIEQIDYKKVLAGDATDRHVTRRDDLWMGIVRAILERRKWMDEGAQRRLLEIAGDSSAIAELAHAVMAPGRAADGSPLVATQAATVLASFQRLNEVVARLAPDKKEELLRRLADAAARIDAPVVMEMLHQDDGSDPESLTRQLAPRFDEERVAQMLAVTLASQGAATDRLAGILHTLAPDEHRRTRVLASTRSALGVALGESEQLNAMWSSMEELLVSYDEKHFVSAPYRASLDRATTRAQELAGPDQPPELGEWMATVSRENLRRLSVRLLLDLLHMEQEAQRAGQILGDLAGLAEDLLLAGEYDTTTLIARAIARRAGSDHALGHEAAKRHRDDLARSMALRETVAALGALTPEQFSAFRALCLPLGATLVDSLKEAILAADGGDTTLRAADIIVGYGDTAVPHLAPLLGRTESFVLVELARILGRIGAAAGVAVLQPLLRSTDPAVVAEAVRSLTRIEDGAAARALQTALRAAVGPARQALVAALVDQRDPRVVPVLLRILTESDAFGADHGVALDALEALGLICDDRAVPTLSDLLHRRSWLAPRRTRAVREATIAVLRRLGTERALAALSEASVGGDASLRRLAGAAARAPADPPAAAAVPGTETLR